MFGATADKEKAYVTIGYENKKSATLQGSTDKQAAYAVLDNVFK